MRAAEVLISIDGPVIGDARVLLPHGEELACRAVHISCGADRLSEASLVMGYRLVAESDLGSIQAGRLGENEIVMEGVAGFAPYLLMLLPNPGLVIKNWRIFTPRGTELMYRSLEQEDSPYRLATVTFSLLCRTVSRAEIAELFNPNGVDVMARVGPRAIALKEGS